MHRRETRGTGDSRPVRELIGLPIPEAAGDRKAAGKYVDQIITTLDRVTLSEQERRALYKQRSKWKKRAEGHDTRWNAVGVRPGQLKHAKPAIADNGLTEADASDPLLQTIEAKFGKGAR